MWRKQYCRLKQEYITIKCLKFLLLLWLIHAHTPTAHSNQPSPTAEERLPGGKSMGKTTEKNNTFSLLQATPAAAGIRSQRCQRSSRHKGLIRSRAQQGLRLHTQDSHVVMDNGIVQVTISRPGGFVTGVQFNGIDNLLEGLNHEDDRGYWDLVWSNNGNQGTRGISERVKGTAFKVIVETEDQLELSFTKTWDASQEAKLVPLKIDQRYVLLRNSSGFYSYAIYEHLKEWPAFFFPRTRLAFKLRKDKFNYMALSDKRQRYMPLPDDRFPNRSQALAYPEAVLLVNPIEPEFKGEVDDKYQYSCEFKDLLVHGWISSHPLVGFWQITPSSEFRSGGPLKQELSSHVGPANLAIFHSPHYVGVDLVLKFEANEPWKKVYGPVFTYLNSGSNGSDKVQLWEDAKKQMMSEVNSWPYSFPASEDFPKSEQRGNVLGRVLVQDRYISKKIIIANGSYVGLAPPGDVGSWQRDGKGYQFWSKTNDEGYFSINHIRAGNYSLFAWVPGFVGECRSDAVISIEAGSNVDLGDLVYEPPRDGPTLWEIGYPDRYAAEFYIPDPDPKLINKLYVNFDRFRQYGLWDRYTDLYPHEDLVYTVGISDYRKDWFFAQVNRRVSNNTYRGTTWQIKFKIEIVNENATYKLRVALACSNGADLQVRVNNPKADPPLFSSGQVGNDNAIARHGIHGIYHLYNVDVRGAQLVDGDNIIFLTQPISTSRFQGIMYDYIRLEGPSS